MYKNKDKQREADRERQRHYRRRDKNKAKGVTEQGVTAESVTVPLSIMGKHDPKDQESFKGVCGVNAEITGRPESKKRGKAIKCFEDLPLDVQATIDRMSTDRADKVKRTKRAVAYEHLFPDSRRIA